MKDPNYPAAGKAWTLAETELFIKYWPKATVEELSRLFKRPPGGIEKKAQKEKLVPKSSVDMIDKEFLTELRQRENF